MTTETTKQNERGTEWYCLSSPFRQEHVASQHLRQLDAEIEVFLPRIKFRRMTTRGSVWYIEALFPTYIFCRFNLDDHLRAVLATRGITSIIQFGSAYPSVDEDVIEDLRNRFPDNEIITLSDGFHAGDLVEIKTEPLQGFDALISQYYPSIERVGLLFEMFGREHEIKLPPTSVANKEHRERRLELAN